MSSFFTTPASQRKRKREDVVAAPLKRRNLNSKSTTKSQKLQSLKANRDESISGSGSDDEAAREKLEDEVQESSSESKDEDETGAERRLRLAEQYLENIKGEVDEIGFDAEDIDRDLIAKRLQEDVAETKGRLYRHITSHIDFPAASKTHFRADTLTTTSIAVCPPYVYTVSKDLTLIKWKLASPHPPPRPPSKKRKPSKNPPQPPPPPRRRPTKLLFTKGNKFKSNDPSYKHHTSSILTVAASSSGKFVATGGDDKRLIIWSAADLTPLRVFTQHRDAITSLSFRRNTNQLFSSSRDRTIKTWGLDELAYVETLHGHQDEVVDVAALAQESCVSVGARDRTARLWKVIEETQLVFRGGGRSTSGEKKPNPRTSSKDTEHAPIQNLAEGSIDRVALIDEETFITGSDNGSLCLWTLHKKKPVFTVPLAHGLDPPLSPEEASAEKSPNLHAIGEPQPRWITALVTVPYSDLILSGSWDGWVRVWRVSVDKKRVEQVGVLGKQEAAEGEDGQVEEENIQSENSKMEQSVRGVINDIGVFERGERGKDGICVVVATGTEHRLGRWKTVKGKNGAVVFEVPRKQLENGVVVGVGGELGDVDKEAS